MQTPREPSPRKSPTSMPMAPVAPPLLSNPKPVRSATSLKRQSPWLRKRWFWTVSLATRTSVRPSPSRSRNATPRALPMGAPVAGLATWIPASSDTSVNVPSPLF